MTALSKRPLHFPPKDTNHNSTGLAANEQKKGTEDTDIYPLSDENAWYYPSHGHDSDEEESPSFSKHGNWGKKHSKGARWIRRGKMTPWGPAMDDWEAEERTRKRIKLLLPRSRRSPSPPTLPCLRSPSPPIMSPYPPPISQHLSYTSFVMDKSVTHTFRSSLLDESEYATNGLIEDEVKMKTALGKLWQVISEDPDERRPNHTSVVPKLEDNGDDTDDQDARERRLARAPDLTPSAHKHLLPSYRNGGPPEFEPSHIVSPETQLENLEKGLASLRELQDDAREYVERLQEIREGLGIVKFQRDKVWQMVREKAIQELQDAAFSTSV